MNSIVISMGPFPFKKVNIVFECSDHDRGRIKDGKRYAQILDGFQQEVQLSGFKTITLAKPRSRVIRMAYGNVLQTMSALSYLLLIISRASKLGFAKKLYERHRVAKYINFLQASGCQMVIGIQPTHELVMAAKYLGLPIADLLHGYGISRKHRVYGPMALQACGQLHLCTDYICLDRNTAKSISLYLEEEKLNARCWSYLSPVLKSNASGAVHKKFRSRFKKTFLITLQWGVHRFEKKRPHVDGEIPPLISEVINHSDAQNYGFLVRPHPILLQNSDAMRRLTETIGLLPNVEIDLEQDLAAVLNVIDGHLTLYSSTTREAAIMGKPSFLFSSDDELFEGEEPILAVETSLGIAMRVSYLRPAQIIDIIADDNSLDEQIYDELRRGIQPAFIDGTSVVRAIFDKLKMVREEY